MLTAKRLSPSVTAIVRVIGNWMAVLHFPILCCTLISLSVSATQFALLCAYARLNNIVYFVVDAARSVYAKARRWF